MTRGTSLRWVIQNNMFSEAGFERLLSALDRYGSSYSLHKVVPFSHTLEPEVTTITSVSYQAAPDAKWEALPISERFVVMGSYTLAKIAKNRGWTPGAWINDECLSYYEACCRWREYMLNYHHLNCSLASVPRQDQLFIRPDADSKAFVGQVMTWDEFSAWRDKVMALPPEDAQQVSSETLCVVAEPKQITREWRTWIVDGKVVTASQYKLGGRPCYDAMVDARVLDFAGARVAEWNPLPAFCLDVFECDGDLKIGELNCLNAAGFYKADMVKVVGAIEAMVMP